MSDENPPAVTADPVDVSNDDMDDGPPTLMIVEDSAASTPTESSQEEPTAPSVGQASSASASPEEAAKAPTPPQALPPPPALTPPPTLQAQPIQNSPVVTPSAESSPLFRPVLSLQSPLTTPTVAKSGAQKAPKLASKLSQKVTQLHRNAGHSLPCAPKLPQMQSPLQTPSVAVIQPPVLSKPPVLVPAVPAPPTKSSPPPPTLQPQQPQPVELSAPQEMPKNPPPQNKPAVPVVSTGLGPSDTLPQNARPKARPRKPRVPKQPQPAAPVMLPPQPNQPTMQAPIFNQVTDPQQFASIFNMISQNKVSTSASLPGHVKIAPKIAPKWTGFNMPMNMMQMPLNMTQFCNPSTSFSGIDMHHLITPQHPQQPSSSSMQPAAPTFQVMNGPPVLVNNAEQQRRGPIITEIDDNEADGPPQLTSEVDNEVKGARNSEEASTAIAVEAALAKGVRSQFYPIFHFIDGLVIEEGPSSFRFENQLSDCDVEEEETDSEAEQEAIANVLVKALKSQLNIDSVRVRQNAAAGASPAGPSDQAGPAPPAPAAPTPKPKAPETSQTPAKKRSPKEKKEKKEKPIPVKEKVRKRRSKKTDELQKLLNMDFGPGEAPFRTTSKDEYVREMKKKEAQQDGTPRRAAAVAAKKSMESMEVDEPQQQKPADVQSPPKRAAAVAARKSFESLDESMEDAPEPEEEILNPTDLRPPPRADQPHPSEMPRSAFDIPVETYCLQCRKSLRDGFYRRHPQYCSKVCRKLYRRGTAVIHRQPNANASTTPTSAAAPPLPVPEPPVMSMPLQLKSSPVSQPPSPRHPNVFEAPAPVAPPPMPAAPIQETPKKAPSPPPRVAPLEAPVLAPIPPPPPSVPEPKNSASPPRAKSPEEKRKQRIDIDVAMNWTMEEVAEFVQNLTQNSQCVEFFREHLIDGRSFLLLVNDKVESYPLKLGPRVKIQNALNDIKPQLLAKPISSIKNRGEEVDNLMKQPVDEWSQENVAVWASKVTGSSEVGDFLQAEEVDGSALLYLAQEEQLDARLSQKKGPWLNLKNALNELKSKQSQ